MTRTGMLSLILVCTCGQAQSQTDPNNPGIIEPTLSALSGKEVRIPFTDQAVGDTLLNLAEPVTRRNALGATSITGHTITRVSSPNRDMRDDLRDLVDAASAGESIAMTTIAQDLMDILLGETQGRVYDGFAMLNFNRGAFVPDHVPGEYKMKVVRDTGETAPGIDGVDRKIWEVDVNHFWYDGQFDSDTFLIRIPIEVHKYDTLRVNYHIYSLEREDFSPTVVMADNRLPGSVQFPFKGFDAVWVPVGTDEVVDISVDMPPVHLLRGVYNWGWRVHPPRIQFLQTVTEIVNAHTGEVELDPQSMSYATRNRELSIDGIADAAPEKKMYDVATAVLNGASASDVLAMLSDPNTAPRGVSDDWADLAEDQLQIPPEAYDILAQQGIGPGDFGDGRFISVYMNNEMYGRGPSNGVDEHGNPLEKNKIAGWHQGDQFHVKLVNLDKHAHYFRNVDFGPKLHNDIDNGNFPAGSHSFEIMNFKPTYGVPKIAEAQWRAGWGFRPHYDVIQQSDVFSRDSDLAYTMVYADGDGGAYTGYQFSSSNRGGDFRFNPPQFIIGTHATPSAFRFKEIDGSEGLLIGQHTEGYGIAKMCSADEFPLGEFCSRDIGPFNPNGVYNVDTDGDGVNDQLWFPPFLRNPDPDAGGDAIPPTPAWKPFLWINPNNGTLYIDPDDHSKGYWADLTYAHGRPIAPGTMLDATIEAPRASGQVFYQFDDLFHDNAIFSPHPTFSPSAARCAADLAEPYGVLNFFDISRFIAAFTEGEFVADFTNDGQYNFFDVSAFLGAYSTGCP
jgi:hypothetical protein